MARIETDPNYTAPTFSRATAPVDLFKKEDVQNLAAAVSGHTHGAGLGLPIAASAIPAGTITSAMIADGGITTADIGDQQVSAAKIAPGAVGQGQLADGAVITQKIADAQVTSAKLAPNIAFTGSLTVTGSGPIILSGPIRIQAPAAQQASGLNLANGTPVAWRNFGNTADVFMVLDDHNDLSLVGFRSDGGTVALTGTAPATLRVVFNGTQYRIPLMV